MVGHTQAFSQKLKVGHPRSMFLVNCLKDYVNFECIFPKVAVHRTPGRPSDYNTGHTIAFCPQTQKVPQSILKV